MATASVRKIASQVEATPMELDDAPDFVEIEKLQELGINAADIQKLKTGGFPTVELLLATPSKVGIHMCAHLYDGMMSSCADRTSMSFAQVLLAVKGISDAKLEKVLEACRKLKPQGFISGTEYLHEVKSRIRISTGSKELDRLLGGGIEVGNVTEFFGENRCGKTQICATLVVTTQLDAAHGGAAGKVIYIDTEGGFRPERAAEIAETRYGLKGTDVLDNLLYAQAATHEHQHELLTAAVAKITEDEAPYKLLILDGLMSNFRTEFSGRGELAERQQKLAVHVSKLLRIASALKIAVVVTNQVTADPGNMFVPDAKKPVGGNIVGHAMHYRVQLRKGKGDQRVAKLYSGPGEEGEATFEIKSGRGIEDPE